MEIKVDIPLHDSPLQDNSDELLDVNETEFLMKSEDESSNNDDNDFGELLGNIDQSEQDEQENSPYVVKNEDGGRRVRSQKCNTLKCPVCGKGIPTRPNFHRHLLVHIICGKLDEDLTMGKELYKCDLCGFLDNTPRKLLVIYY